MRVALVLLALLAIAAPARGDWSPRPNAPLNSADTSATGISAATVAGVPYVAWAEANDSVANGTVYVARPQDGTFARVGGAVTSTGREPELADVGGVPHIAVHDNYQHIKVFSLQSGAWVQVGPSITATSQTRLGGLIDLGGQPAIAYTKSNTAIEVDKLMGDAWAQVGATISAHADHDPGVGFAPFAAGPSIVANGGQPIVGVSESKPAEFGSQLFAYAYRLESGAWTALNGDQPLAPATGDGFLNGLTMVGTTPYVAFDQYDGTTLTGGVFSLAGTSPVQLGGPVVTDGGGSPTSMAIGAYQDAPMAVVKQFTAGDEHLVAKTLSGSEWTQVGSPLGIPPLPTVGNTYAGAAIAVDTAANVPYVIFQQQAPGQELFQNAYVEGNIPGAVSPTAPTRPDPGPPTITVTEDPPAAAPAATATPVPPAAAALELAGRPRLKGRRLTSGVRAVCPAGGPACAGTVTVKRAKRPCTVPAGKQPIVKVVLAKRLAKRLRHHRAKVTVRLTGPNGATAALATVGRL